VKQFLVKIALFLCMLLFLPDLKKCPVSITPYFLPSGHSNPEPQLFCAMLGTSQVQTHRVPPPSPLFAKEGRHHLNEEFTPLLPQGLARDIAKPYQI